MTEQAVAGRIARGVRLAGVWRVECVLQDDEEPSAVLARSDGGSRAVCFLLGSASAPHEDPVAESAWGVKRTHANDEEFGLVVVDALGLDARPLAAVESEDPSAASRARDAVAETARREADRGRPHGRIRRELVFLTGPSGVHVAGWGLSSETTSSDGDDAAALVSGSLTPAAPSAGPPSLAAATRSENRDLLRRSIEAAVARGDADTDGDEFARARDALQRIETRIDSCLTRAERQLAVRDPLGAVAACREAVRFGAGPRAERLLRRARRQAKDLLTPPNGKPKGKIVVGAAAVAVVLLAAFFVLRPSGTPGEELSTMIDQAAAERGERAAMRLALTALGRSTADVPATMLDERVSRLVAAERETLLGLRRDAIADGMRPHHADEVAREAFAGLESLPGSVGHPALETRVARSLARVDRAAALYRARTTLGAEDAMRAIEQLLELDPVFNPAGRDGGGS